MKTVSLALFIFGCVVGLGALVAMSNLRSGGLNGTNFFAEIMYVSQFIGLYAAVFGAILGALAPKEKRVVS